MSTLDLFNLEGKTALVTGCTRGIGKAIAVALAEAGADIIGVSASLSASGSEVEQEVKAPRRRSKGYACDFADRSALYHFMAQMKADFPVIDILVNNAGTILRKPAAEYPNEYWDTIIAVNQSSQALRNDPVRPTAILERIPAGGWGTIDDFKGPVVFLASSASDYVSGEILTVDGGWMDR